MKQNFLRYWLLFICFLFLFAGSISLSSTALAEGDNTSSAQESGALKAHKKVELASSIPNFALLAGDLAKTLIFCAAGLLVILSAVKRFQAKRENIPSPIEIIARKTMGARSALLLVSVEGKRFLLAQSAESLKLLAKLDESLTFSDHLQGLIEVEDLEKELPPQQAMAL